MMYRNVYAHPLSKEEPKCQIVTSCTRLVANFSSRLVPIIVGNQLVEDLARARVVLVRGSFYLQNPPALK